MSGDQRLDQNSITSTRRLTFPVALWSGLGAGLAVPLVDLWRDCQLPISEACVWGKAYLSLSLGLGGILGLAAGALVYVVVIAMRR